PPPRTMSLLASRAQLTRDRKERCSTRGWTRTGPRGRDAWGPVRPQFLPPGAPPMWGTGRRLGRRAGVASVLLRGSDLPLDCRASASTGTSVTRPSAAATGSSRAMGTVHGELGGCFIGRFPPGHHLSGSRPSRSRITLPIVRSGGPLRVRRPYLGVGRSALVASFEHERPGSERRIGRGPGTQIESLALDIVNTGHSDHHPLVRHLHELLPSEIPQSELCLVDRAPEEIRDHHERQARMVWLGTAEVVEGL